MILAIVGSVRLGSSPAVFREVRRVLYKYRPEEIISGNNEGVDSVVERVAREFGIYHHALPVEVHRWDGAGQIGYKQRNEQIATCCDRLVRIDEPQPLTNGTAWTLDYARKLGKPTEETIIAA